MNVEDQDELRRARAAAIWNIRLDSEGAGCRAEFLAWLLESSRNVESYLQVADTSLRLDGMDPRREIDVAALIAQANESVVPITFESVESTEMALAVDSKDERPVGSGSAKRWRLAGVAVLLVVGAIFWMAALPTRSAQTYTTQVGEQLAVKLKDGSLIHLNTNSQVQVRYTPQERDIQLVQGEALFTVERDLDRPFRVSTETTVVRAVGTKFDVYRQPERTLIAVVDGDVDVLPQRNEGSALPVPDRSDPHAPTSEAPDAAHLAAGEQASVDLYGKIHRDAQRNVQPAENWLQRRLVFEEATLGDVAAEFNRYNRAQIVVKEEDLRKRLISGSFSADHPQTLFLYLQRLDESVVVDTKSDEFVIRFRPRDAS